MDIKKTKQVVVRKLVKLNESLYVNLPKPFVERHGLRSGDSVAVMMGESLKVTTMEQS